MMDKLKSLSKRYILLGMLVALISMSLVFEAQEFYEEYKLKQREEFVTNVKTEVKKIVSTSLETGVPKVLKFDNEYFKVEYSFDEKLEEFIKKEIRRYRPDFASVVVIENSTGKILSAVDFKRKENEFSRSLAFSATHPAASIFKMVTAADLIENHNMDKHKKFSINGRGTTLYKYQLKDKKNRWTRYIPFSSAFAYSNNPIFGKAAIKESSSQSLYNMGIKLGFNQSLMNDFGLGMSRLQFPDTDYELAEVSSGFNRETLISPVHGAVLASVIGNGGILRKPHLVSKLQSANFDISFEDPGVQVLTPTSSEEISTLMERTVKRGTARGAFRRLNSKLKKSLDLGGKTGSITGGVPYGKRDWFVMYANPNENYQKHFSKEGEAFNQPEGISLCVMMVNKKKWYVKSTYLARRVIEYYYREKQLVN